MLLCGQLAFAESLNLEWLSKKDLNEWGMAALYACDLDVSERTYGYERDLESHTTTDYARYILGDRAKGLDVSGHAEKIVAAQLPSGKFSDFIDEPSEDLINAHIWAILGLYMSYEDDYDKEAALEWLQEHQSSDGSFALFVSGVADGNGSPDMTAMGICAYAALGLSPESEEIVKAMAFVNQYVSEQEKTRSGASAETISWWLISKSFLRQEITEAEQEQLKSYALADDSYIHLKGNRRGNYMATYHAYLTCGDLARGTSWMHELRYRDGFRTTSGAEMNLERIVEMAINGEILPDVDGGFSWELIREALLNNKIDE